MTRVAAAAAALALLLYAGGVQAPPAAQAVLPAPCVAPPPPGAGAVTYRVFATQPGPGGANGVCITLAGTGGTMNSGAVIQTPPTCPAIPVAVGASGAGAKVWADWGAAGACVAVGQTVVLEFKGMAGIPLGRQVGAALWDNTAVGDATVWPAACPAAAAGPGAVPLVAISVAPAGAGAAYDGVCMNLPAPGPVSGPVVGLNPVGCGPPAAAPAPPVGNPVVGPFVSAAASQIWVDWTVKCAAAGSVVRIVFLGPAALIGLCAGCATWLGSSAISDVTITAGVGGVSVPPDRTTLPASESASGGTGYAPYAGGGAAVTVLLAVGLAGVWYLRRRRQQA